MVGFGTACRPSPSTVRPLTFPTAGGLAALRSRCCSPQRQCRTRTHPKPRGEMVPLALTRTAMALILSAADGPPLLGASVAPMALTLLVSVLSLAALRIRLARTLGVGATHGSSLSGIETSGFASLIPKGERLDKLAMQLIPTVWQDCHVADPRGSAI